RTVVRYHYQRPRRILRLVPGMEQLFFVAPVGIVEQAPADALHEAARQQRAARPARPGEDRRLDRPHAEIAEMLERFAIGVGNDEAGVAFALRPVERERDLVRPELHGWALGG